MTLLASIRPNRCQELARPLRENLVVSSGARLPIHQFAAYADGAGPGLQEPTHRLQIYAARRNHFDLWKWPF